ncbi:MAG TPA: NAD(P)H-dependent glycerol-3-phosphate dehydrogenase [Nitrospinota bacterium]|nr:NAD(P)H-dependent glycerol-3-phosphate dehydrogenase [Nitrospinota bacterium]
MVSNNKTKEQIAIIGAGSWGTALANLLGSKDYPIKLWVYEKDLFHYMKKYRENNYYLPRVRISVNIVPVHSLEEAVDKSDIIISATPSHTVRDVMSKTAPYVPKSAIIISVSKGIEEATLMTMSEVIRDVLPKELNDNVLVLSGPSFAKEVSLRKLTAVVIASENIEMARDLQHIFNTPFFRVYTNNDIKGVELGGAYKNVIAIATGVCDGLELGFNARAALITRGLAEISRLGLAMGANPITFSGLAGMGDLVLTCTGKLSRNRDIGLKLGKGMKLEEILKEMKMVAEGINTTKSIVRLGEKYNIELPIAEKVYDILFKDKGIKDAVSELMGRDLKGETEI